MKKHQKNHFWNIALFTKFNLLINNVDTRNPVGSKNIAYMFGCAVCPGRGEQPGNEKCKE